MIIPYIPDDLFKVNDNLSPKFEGEVIIIDNYYKNIEQIQELISNSYVPRWKWNKDTRNFKDYYDCRHVLPNNYFSYEYTAKMEYLANLIRHYYKDPQPLEISEPFYEFNIFKHINLPSSNNMQMFPHRDAPYAALVYLDNISSGGTAMYDSSVNIENTEASYLFTDISKYPKKVTQARTNRLVLFRANIPHGGYIENHSRYLNDWRINQVMFFDPLNTAAPNRY
jgi:hypothetical protein